MSDASAARVTLDGGADGQDGKRNGSFPWSGMHQPIEARHEEQSTVRAGLRPASQESGNRADVEAGALQPRGGLVNPDSVIKAWPTA